MTETPFKLFSCELEQLSETAQLLPIPTLRELYPESVLPEDVRKVLNYYPLFHVQEEIANLFLLTQQVNSGWPTSSSSELITLTSQEKNLLESIPDVIENQELQTFTWQLDAHSEGEISFAEVIRNVRFIVTVFIRGFSDIAVLAAHTRLLEGAIYTLVLPKVFSDEEDLADYDSDENDFVPFKDAARQAANVRATQKLIEGMQSYLNEAASSIH